MMKKITICAVLLTAIIFSVFVSFAASAPNQMFNTSIIENEWENGVNFGTIRMVGAWMYEEGVVEDEQGQLWNVDHTVTAEDFLLLWIADNNTPDVMEDDIIVKMWKEVY